MSDQAVAESKESRTSARRLRTVWWIGFVAAPVVGVIAMLIIAFVVLRLPFPLSR